MTSAYSYETRKSYNSWDDLVKAEASGYTVVSILRELKSQKPFARVMGIYGTQKEAKKEANLLRRRWNHIIAKQSSTELLRVTVEPIWHNIRPSKRDD